MEAYTFFSFMHGRSDVRAQRFKKQTKKNAVVRRSRVQIVDNSKWGTAQMHEEPEFVISYRKRKTSETEILEMKFSFRKKI